MTNAASSFPRLDSLQARLPVRREDLALFLDLDGTLLDIAATPSAVVVPGDLVADLTALFDALDGALAIVSGRDLGEIDALLSPLRLPAAGGHGATIRLPGGEREEVVTQVPETWIDSLLKLQFSRPGVLIERKKHGVVAHFRNAPAEAALVLQTAQGLVSEDPERFELLGGKMVIEIRPRGISKGRAVHAFMPVTPFRGRMPVFVGDDETDEEGFEAAVQLGGVGLHVARSFGGEPQHVRNWLKQLAQS
jgi:trehalose 6-phosphate phosphatase